MRLRWKKDPHETGLAAVMARPRSSRYHDGETDFARIYCHGRYSERDGWYFVSRVGGELRNSHATPAATEEEAKRQAEAYIKAKLGQGQA